MKSEEVDERLQKLGWETDPSVRFTLLERKSILRELLEQTHDGTGHKQNAYRHLSQKTKEELKQICVELRIHLTGNETKPQLTRKIKEKQAPPEVLTGDTLADFGKHRGQTYEWIWSHDASYCLWATDTVIEEGDKCSRALRRLAEYIESRRHQQPRTASGGASASTSAAPASPNPASPAATAGEDPEVEIERLQKQMDELKSQLSSRRRKTAPKDAEMQKAIETAAD